MNTSINFSEAFVEAVGGRTSVIPYDDGHLVLLPWDLGDGEGISLFVREIGDGVFDITDRGLAADSLSLVGVNLAAGVAEASWKSIQRSVQSHLRFARPDAPFEIGCSATRQDVGVALAEVGQAVLRADGLRVLSSRARARTFGQRVIVSAARSDLAVVPRARLRNKWGGIRRVTVGLTATLRAAEVPQEELEPKVFLQALPTSGDGNDGFDHVHAIFAGAELPKADLVSAVPARGRLKQWQRKSLSEFSTVVEEDELPSYLEDLGRRLQLVA